MNFVPADMTYPWLAGIHPDLTLVPCKQDLRQDRTPTCTKAKFDIWNEDETKFTGAYQCLKCLWEGFLDQIGTDRSGFGGEKFTVSTIKTLAARFRVQSANNGVCKPHTKGCESVTGVLTPFLGVMLYAAEETGGAILPFAAYTPTTTGYDGSGFVLWDAAGGTTEVPGQ